MESAVILANPRSLDYMVGGAENQLIQLGLELSARGKSVTLVGTVDHDPSDESYAYKQINGSWSRPKGWWKLFLALREIKPDICVIRVLNPLLPIYGILCSLLRIKLIYFCAHDWEIESRPDKRIQGWRWRLFWIGIHFTKRIFVQNAYQESGFKRLLMWRKNKVSIIRNIPLMKPVEKYRSTGEFFTWLGSYRPHKRPEWVIEIARQLPDYQFQIILDSRGKKSIEQIFESASDELDNLTFVPGVPRGKLSEIYRKSKAVLITSEGEGFPNIAIEAWSQGRAVISTVNNSLLDFSESGAVMIAEEVRDLVSIITNTDDGVWEQMGKDALGLFHLEFNSNAIVHDVIAVN